MGDCAFMDLNSPVFVDTGEAVWLKVKDQDMDLVRFVKRRILLSGIPPFQRVGFMNALLTYGRWLKNNPSPIHCETREELYKHLSGKLNGEPFDYIEAGVFRGDSIRFWTTLSTCPETRFYGFDTFTGLPDAWHTGLKTFNVGHFDVGGEVPEIPDPRVHFVKGRFQDTVPGFLRTYSRQKNLVIHMDADVYTSTLYFLTRFHDVISDGCYLLFDNFSVAPHDFRAFCDYTSAYGREYDLIGTAEVDFEKVAIELR
jgi:O-methyltransferase